MPEQSTTTWTGTRESIVLDCAPQKTVILSILSSSEPNRLSVPYNIYIERERTFCIYSIMLSTSAICMSQKVCLLHNRILHSSFVVNSKTDKTWGSFHSHRLFCFPRSFNGRADVRRWLLLFPHERTCRFAVRRSQPFFWTCRVVIAQPNVTIHENELCPNS